MSADPHAPATSDSLEPIKRVKSAEQELDAKLSAFLESTKAEVDQLGREADDSVARVRIAGEKARDDLLAKTREDSEHEAALIVQMAETKAAQIKGKSPSDLAGEREPILDAVLGSFRAGGKK
jgi:vacuolar-type H+-ATPase subunit H